MRARRLRHLKMQDVTRLAGDSWTKVWEKLDLTPTAFGSVLVAELYVGETPVEPVVGFLGFQDRMDVVAILMERFDLSEDDGGRFLDCTMSRSDIIAKMERNVLESGADPE